MSGFTLLLSSADLVRHRAKSLADAGLESTNVTWGSGPEHYPCLVATRMDSNHAYMASCYVTVDDAERLLTAVTDAKPPRGGARPKSASEIDSNPGLEWRLGVTANIRAIVQELIDVGVTTESRYSKTMAVCLADADQELAGVRATNLPGSGLTGRGTTPV